MRGAGASLSKKRSRNRVVPRSPGSAADAELRAEDIALQLQNLEPTPPLRPRTPRSLQVDPATTETLGELASQLTRLPEDIKKQISEGTTPAEWTWLRTSLPAGILPEHVLAPEYTRLKTLVLEMRGAGGVEARNRFYANRIRPLVAKYGFDANARIPAIRKLLNAIDERAAAGDNAPVGASASSLRILQRILGNPEWTKLFYPEINAEFTHVETHYYHLSWMAHGDGPVFDLHYYLHTTLITLQKSARTASRFREYIDILTSFRDRLRTRIEEWWEMFKAVYATYADDKRYIWSMLDIYAFGNLANYVSLYPEKLAEFRQFVATAFSETTVRSNYYMALGYFYTLAKDAHLRDRAFALLMSNLGRVERCLPRGGKFKPVSDPVEGYNTRHFTDFDGTNYVSRFNLVIRDLGEIIQIREVEHDEARIQAKIGEWMAFLMRVQTV